MDGWSILLHVNVKEGSLQGGGLVLNWPCNTGRPIYKLVKQNIIFKFYSFLFSQWFESSTNKAETTIKKKKTFGTLISLLLGSHQKR